MSRSAEEYIDQDRVTQKEFSERSFATTDKIHVVDRIEGQEANDHSAATFCIRGEDHTIGNLLRSKVMQLDDVEFCGYSLPHPSEAKLHIRIQNIEGVTLLLLMLLNMELFKKLFTS